MLYAFWWSAIKDRIYGTNSVTNYVSDNQLRLHVIWLLWISNKFHTYIILKGYVHVKKNINMFFYKWLQLDLNPEPLSLTNQPRTTSLAKCFLSVCLRTKGFWVRVQLQLFKLQILRLLQTRSSLTFRQL